MSKLSDVKIATHNERENKYKVGDYVFIEQSQSDPFVIRRIDELQKTAQGNVAAKVVSFYRGRDIPASLGHLADKHANDLAEEMKSLDVNFNEIEKYQLRHREVNKKKDNFPTILPAFPLAPDRHSKRVTDPRQVHGARVERGRKPARLLEAE